jgi:hypothetical protein
MPKIKVNGVSIACEVAGKGPPVVWTPGGWFPRNPSTYVFAGRFSAHYRVLTWDRRNSGTSDMAVEDAESDSYLWADDLYALLHELDMSPAYVLLPNAEWVDYSARYTPQEIQGVVDMYTDEDLGRSTVCTFRYPFSEEFMRRVETGRFDETP